MDSPANEPSVPVLWHFGFLKERILNAVNNDPASQTYGCCDRAYWGWKTRDFPDLTLQYSLLPFGLLLDAGSERDAALLRAMALFWVRHLNRNGSADQSFPGERSAGPTLYGLDALLASHARIRGLLDPAGREALDASIRRSLAFSLAEPERYGHVANHKALFAHAYLLAHGLFGDPAYLEAYTRQIDEIASESREGWFLEYETADPGYQTQCLHYLTQCYEITGDDRLREMIVRAIEDFSAWFVFPNRSYSGLCSGRATELFFPYAFFYWAEAVPVCRDVVDFLYAGPASSGLVKWHALEYPNLIRLGTSYLLSQRFLPSLRRREEFPHLPCSREEVRRWDEAGLVVISDAHKHAMINLKRGGTFKLVSKSSGEEIQDTGYLIEASGARSSSALFHEGGSREASTDGRRLSVKAPFHRVREQYLGAATLVALRLCGSTLLRWPFFADLLKKAMLRTLMLRKQPSPFTLERRVVDAGETLTIEDTIQPQGGAGEFLCSLTERNVPFHMACAGYYADHRAPAGEGYGLPPTKCRGRIAVRTVIRFEPEGVAIERDVQCPEC